ncbi:MAG: hypothetical protein LBM70_00890 [Victivallales bacterium]|jgi:hypothetical protein|nr:hypothetical protein [Victivallales bacterium]
MIRHAELEEFSWSVRRQELWNRCRRSYFLHYYAARGGHDQFADSELRRIHEMRSLLSEKSYLRRLIAMELRNKFYLPHEEENPEFPEHVPRLSFAVMSRFNREFRRMLTGEFQRDHATPMLNTLYDNFTSASEIKARLDRQLSQMLDALESGVWAMLFRSRFLHRRPIDSPLKVAIGHLACFVAPIIAFQERGILSIVANGKTDSTALLLRYYAMNQLHIAPQNVHTLELIPEEGILKESGIELNIGHTLREIRNGAADMLNAIRPSGDVAIDDFPPNLNSCSDCNFRFFCN